MHTLLSVHCPSIFNGKGQTLRILFTSFKHLNSGYVKKFTSFFFLIYLYLFLAALGLHCCAWAFSSCGERGLLFIAVCGLLIMVASPVAERGL